MKSTAALGLLYLFLMVLLARPAVKATRSNRASIIYSSQWLSLDVDRNYMLWACNDIYNLFLGQYTNAEYYYDHVENFHAQTTWALMKSKIIHCENYHTFATVLYIGHGGALYSGGVALYYSIFEQATHNNPNNPPQAIYDYNIYYAPTAGTHRFVFLWACRQGNEAGYYRTMLGPFGMAYCWTRQPELSKDGYGDPDIPGDPDTRPYCFIGFEQASPRLSEPVKESTSTLYKHWLVFFYYYALNGYTIKNALREAGRTAGYQEGWLDTPLRNGFWTYFPPEFLPPDVPPSPDNKYWGRMRIYGNANINLLWG
jgi:hypothetical protein